MTNEEAIAILDTIPTIGDQVDALEMAIEELAGRKTGKWIDRTICSNCNWYATNRYGLAVDSYFPYCPNCGAKMEVDE